MRAIVTSFACLLSLAGAVPLRASIVNFDNLTGPAHFFAAGGAKIPVYSSEGVKIIFSGGVFLTGESGPAADTSTVYASAAVRNYHLSNPVVITFSQPIVDFHADIVNALAGTYTISDSAGGVTGVTVAQTGFSIESKNIAVPLTKVVIQYTGSGIGTVPYDFAIDNISFDLPGSSGQGASQSGVSAFDGFLTPTPEPGAWGILGVGMVSLAIAGRISKPRLLRH